MPYVGFHPEANPCKKHSRPLETMTDAQMRWRLIHPEAETSAHGRVLLADLSSAEQGLGLPDRVVAYGATTRIPLVVFYRLPEHP